MTVREYVKNYRFEMEGGGSYAPTEAEQAMLEDAIEGLIAQVDEMAARVGGEFIVDPEKLKAWRAAHS